jgi:ubiquinone/menaquinone biosynthesis C-methylase UbiE
MDILNLPIIYNSRFLVAGNQSLTKDFILKNYKKYSCKSVLDLGCGTGDFAPLFPRKHYLGIDLSENYINFAKQKYHHQFKVQDIDDFNLNQKFDATIFISTLHHLSDQQIKKIFKKVVKVTKRAIIVVDLNPETDPIRKFLIDLDRGRFVRTTKQKLRLLRNFGEVVELEHFNTRLASQSGIVLIPNYEKEKKH